jgi:putative flippase GtrA
MRKWILALLRDERIRFVIVGGFNTVFQFGMFALFDQGDRSPIRYLGSLYASYAIAIIVAFFLHRRFTFRATKSGNAVVDFFRFASVYVVSLVINTALLPLLVESARLSPLVAQAIVTVITVLLSYFGHKYFSFRRRSETVAETHPELDESATAARSE